MFLVVRVVRRGKVKVSFVACRVSYDALFISGLLGGGCPAEEHAAFHDGETEYGLLGL